MRSATIVDEYGILKGIVTQTDVLEAIAGDLPDAEGEEPEVMEREEGSLQLDGLMSAHDAFDRLGIHVRLADNSFDTIAGFALFRLGHLPEVGEHFDYEGWRFEITAHGRQAHRQAARETGLADFVDPILSASGVVSHRIDA